MIRNIIKINEDKCVGCGLCINACHEGAIGLVDGKAKLLRDDYCDGLGNCLPVCPTNAISFEQREANSYNKEIAPKRVMAKQAEPLACGCPGSNMQTINRKQPKMTLNNPVINTQLRQWPVQIQLVPINAPYFENANLLISADCAAYAYGNFHAKFMKNKVTIIGCPKLDECDYTEKLTEIIRQNNIKTVTIVRMEVPCCGGIEYATIEALRASNKMIPWQVITITTDGNIVES